MTTVDPSNHICGGMEMSERVGSGVFDQCLTQYQRVRRCLWNRGVYWSSNILSLFYKVFLKQKKKVELHAFICSFLQFLFLLILPNFTFFTHIDKPLPVGCTPMSRLFHCDWSEGWTDGLKDCKDASVVSDNITREIEDKKWKNHCKSCDSSVVPACISEKVFKFKMHFSVKQCISNEYIYLTYNLKLSIRNYFYLHQDSYLFSLSFYLLIRRLCFWQCVCSI